VGVAAGTLVGFGVEVAAGCCVCGGDVGTDVVAGTGAQLASRTSKRRKNAMDLCMVFTVVLYIIMP